MSQSSSDYIGREQALDYVNDGHLNREMVMADLFAKLTGPERQLLVCALAGNHPPGLAQLRVPVIRALTKAGARLTADLRREARG